MRRIGAEALGTAFLLISVIASGIIAVLLLASAAAMGESVESSNTSRKLVHGAVFLESVQEDLSSLSPAELLAMNGQQVYSNDDWDDAGFRVEITVFYAAVELLQVEMELVDQNVNRTVATVHTMRAVVLTGSAPPTRAAEGSP